MDKNILRMRGVLLFSEGFTESRVPEGSDENL